MPPSLGELRKSPMTVQQQHQQQDAPEMEQELYSAERITKSREPHPGCFANDIDNDQGGHEVYDDHDDHDDDDSGGGGVDICNDLEGDAQRMCHGDLEMGRRCGQGQGGGREGLLDPSISMAVPITFAHLQHIAGSMHEYSVLDTKRNRLLGYIFLLLLFIGMNIALLAANFQDQQVIEDQYFIPFHMTAFWGVFGFTLLEAFILIATDFVSWDNPTQSALVLFNVVATFATALLFSFQPELYEVPAHFMEYSVQILVTLVSMIFFNKYFRVASTNAKMAYRLRCIELLVWVLVLGLSLLQLSLYAGYPTLSMGPERSAHFCEFTNEIFNGLFALLYAVISYSDVREKLEQHYTAMRPSSLIV